MCHRSLTGRAYALPLAGFLLCASACNHAEQQPGRKPVDLTLLNQAEAAYRTNTLQSAWTNLLHHRDALKDWQSSGRQGLNYDLSLAVVNGRLAVMSERLGLTNDAAAFFKESARYFNGQSARLHLPKANYSHEEISRLIEQWDGTNFVAWRASSNGTPGRRWCFCQGSNAAALPPICEAVQCGAIVEPITPLRRSKCSWASRI